MALTNSNAAGNYGNHRFDGLTVVGDLLLANAAGQSVALGVDAASSMLANATALVSAGGTYRPSDHGFKAWAYDPVIAVNSTIMASAGLVYAVRLKIPTAMSITNCHLFLNTAGSTLTAGQCFIGLYQNGALVGASTDRATAWQSSGLTTDALSGGPFTVAAGDVQVCFFANGSTLPTPARSTGTAGLHNANLADAVARFATADSGRTTSLPATLAATTAVNLSYWCAVS